VDDDAFGGLLSKKKSNEVAYKGTAAPEQEAQQAQALLDAYFENDDALDETELFLKDYFRNQVILQHQHRQAHQANGSDIAMKRPCR
jgi:hypothetical protein